MFIKLIQDFTNCDTYSNLHVDSVLIAVFYFIQLKVVVMIVLLFIKVLRYKK